jgi:hypothetical protein
MRPALFLATALLLPAATVPAGEKKSTRVEGTVLVPKEVPSFGKRVVEIRLYSYDPQIAGKAADLVEKVELKDFSHTAGKETRKAFVVGAKGALEPRMRYYLTLFLLEGGRRTHIGECEPGKGPCKVLTDGNPSKVVVKVRAVKS